MSRRNEDKKTIQQLMHYHGVEEFLAMVAEAMGDAAEDTECLEDPNVSTRYSFRQMQIQQLSDEQPTREQLKELREEPN